MKIVGLTGNFASGKSEAVRCFRRLGAEVFDADEVSRRLTRKGTPVYRAIVQIFGKAYLLPGGQLDRRKIAERVFKRPADLKKLNILIHPGVIFECLKRIERLRGRAGVLVLDVPLLFESKMERLVDATVVVRCSKEKMLQRAARKGVTPGLARKILSTQWPSAKKARLADFVIENGGTLGDLEKGVRDVWERIARHST